MIMVFGRGNLAPTLTKINESLTVPNVSEALYVKVRAKQAVSPPIILFSQISQIQAVDLGWRYLLTSIPKKNIIVTWEFLNIGGIKMKKILLVLLIISVSMLTTGLAAEDKVIAEDSEHFGDIKIEKGNLRIGEAADVMGNIFIEEGDLFIADDVDIVGSITIKKGNIFIKDDVDITKTVTIEQGNISMEDNNDIHADIICKKGTVKMGRNNDIHGDVCARELKRGSNSDIEGKFIKTEEH
jgi:hypothetical protein